MKSARIVRGLVAAQFLSATGSQMTWFAVSWFVLATTGSPARTSVVIVAPMAAILLVGVHSGQWVTRWGARRTLLVCDGARAPLLAAVPTLHHFGLLSYPLLVVLMFVVGLFFSPYFTAQRLLLAEVAGADEGRLGSANSMLQAAVQLPSLLGPSIAGVLSTVVGPTNVLYIEAVTLLCTFATVAMLTRGHSVSAVHQVSPRPSAGVVTILRDRLLRAIMINSATAEIAFQVLVVALQVMVVTRYGGESVVAGVLIGSWGAGVLAGTIVAAVVSTRVRAVNLVLLGAVFCLPLWLLPVSVPAWTVVLVLLLSGVCHGVALGPRTVLRTTRVAEHLRAQVFAADITATMGTGMLGLLVAGIALDRVGLVPVLVGVVLIGTLGGVPVLLERFAPAGPDTPTTSVRRASDGASR